jgi:hypothetical protein
MAIPFKEPAVRQAGEESYFPTLALWVMADRGTAYIGLDIACVVPGP